MGNASGLEQQQQLSAPQLHKHKTVEERRRMNQNAQHCQKANNNRLKKKLVPVTTPRNNDSKEMDSKEKKIAVEEDEPKMHPDAQLMSKGMKQRAGKTAYVRNWVDRMGRTNVCDPQIFAINGYNSRMKSDESTWMKNHPMEGDGIVLGFYNFLTKRNPKTMKPCRDIFVPDTVVFERNFPRGWYTTDVKAREVMRKQGRELDASTIENGFKEDVPDTCPMVATYLNTREEVLDGRTVTQTTVEVFNKDTIGAFLSRKDKQEGILQKFVMPKGYHNSVIKAVWSPRVCMVQRRTNKFSVFDKKRAENDPFSSAVTYEGPTYLSEEGTMSGNVAKEVKKLCGHIVQHFYYTEHKFITRMVVYFKADQRSRIWFLWCGSLRVSDRNAASEMPVNLVTYFTEPNTTALFNENHLLWEADQAYLRVTNDEMFYEIYMKNGRPIVPPNEEDDKSAQPAFIQGKKDDSQGDVVEKTGKRFDWGTMPAQVQETFVRISRDHEEICRIFEDIFYQARSYFAARKEPYVIEIPNRAVEIITKEGIVEIMQLLQLTQRHTEDGTIEYIMNYTLSSPITKMQDDCNDWINNLFYKRETLLKDSARRYENDQNTIQMHLVDV